MSGETGFVAVVVIDLHFPEAGSLKGKRKELSSIKAQLQGRLGWSVSETGHHDRWQRARLTAATTSGSLGNLAAATDRAQRWLEARCPDGVRMEKVVVSVEELRDGIPSLSTEG